MKPQSTAASVPGPRAVLERVTREWLAIGDRYRLQQYGVLFSPGATRAAEWHEIGRRLVGVLAEGARAGQLRDDVDPECLASLWGGMVLAGGELVAESARDPEDVARHIVRLVAR